MLHYSRDKIEGTQRSGEKGGEPYRYVTPGLSDYLQGAQEQCEDNEWDAKKRKRKELRFNWIRLNFDSSPCRRRTALYRGPPLRRWCARAI